MQESVKNRHAPGALAELQDDESARSERTARFFDARSVSCLTCIIFYDIFI